MTEEKIQQANLVHLAAPGSLSALRAATVGAPLDALRAFAQDVMRDWPESLGCDGFDLQDLAEKHGLLRLKTPKPTQPCLEEGCSCASYYSPEEFAEGVDCFERTELLTGDGAPTGNSLKSEWIPVDERRPEIGTSCIVWIAPEWDALEPFAAVDRWDEWRESPVSFSSATVVVGEGWMESDPAEVTHWMPLPGAPTGQSRTSEAGEATCASNEPDEQNTDSLPLPQPTGERE